MKTTEISRQTGRGISIAVVSKKDLADIYITLRPANMHETPSSMLDRAACALEKRRAAVVKFDMFGPLESLDDYAECLARAYGGLPWPVTLVGSALGSGTGPAGIQIHAVAGVPVKTVFSGDKPVARVYEDGFAKYCSVGNLLAVRPSAPRNAQALEVFTALEKTLGLAGMGIRNLVRTWFYIDDILSWYGGFNAVRREFFSARNMAGKFMPASTGVGAGNPARAALVAGALAVKPKTRDIKVQTLPSPMQCPAPDYGSLFSRAVEISGRGCRTLFVSGTASIDAGGGTAHAGDAAAQIPFTMKIVETLLASRGMDWSDITRTVAYFRNAADFAVFDRHYRKFLKSCVRPLVVQSVICRDDLLFEIEVDAVSGNP